MPAIINHPIPTQSAGKTSRWPKRQQSTKKVLALPPQSGYIGRAEPCGLQLPPAGRPIFWTKTP